MLRHNLRERTFGIFYPSRSLPRCLRAGCFCVPPVQLAPWFIYSARAVPPEVLGFSTNAHSWCITHRLNAVQKLSCQAQSWGRSRRSEIQSLTYKRGRAYTNDISPQEFSASQGLPDFTICRQSRCFGKLWVENGFDNEI